MTNYKQQQQQQKEKEKVTKIIPRGILDPNRRFEKFDAVMTGVCIHANNLENLNEELLKYNLISNLHEDEEHNLEGVYSVRKTKDLPGTFKFLIRAFTNEKYPLNFCVGTEIIDNHYRNLSIEDLLAKIPLEEQEKILKNTRKEIPNAKKIIGNFYNF